MSANTRITGVTREGAGRKDAPIKKLIQRLDTYIKDKEIFKILKEKQVVVSYRIRCWPSGRRLFSKIHYKMCFNVFLHIVSIGYSFSFFNFNS